VSQLILSTITVVLDWLKMTNRFKRLKNAIAKESIPVNRLIEAQVPAISGDKKTAFETLYKETKNARDSLVLLFGLNALQ
jgi:hypothetical protein